MDNSFPQNKPDPQQPTGFFAKLPMVNHGFKWLANLIEPTAEEQANAGIFLGGEGREGGTEQED